MNYEEFKDSIMAEAKKIAGEGGKVKINQITKNNGLLLDGLIIMKKGMNISPTIYLNGFFQEYKSGRSFDDILKEITVLYYANIDRLKMDMNFYNDFNNISDKIIYKLVNYEKNKEILEKVPYRRILDLALVFCCILSSDESGSASTLIYNSHMDMWNVTEKEIYEKAVVNTPKILEYSIRNIAEIVSEAIVSNTGIDGEGDDFPELAEDTDMYVLTNGLRTNGASCMLYKDVLKNFSEKLDSDLFILPSSIHEVIIIPKENYDFKNLLKMVHEVNCEGVSSDEILSDNVYVYNRKDNCLSM